MFACMTTKLVMGLGQKFLTWAGSGQIFVARIGLGQLFCLGLTLENFPLKSKTFQFFILWVKKILSGQVKKYPGQSRVGFLSIAGQKYAQVRAHLYTKLPNEKQGERYI